MRLQFLALLVLPLLLSGCALFQTSEPIDVRIAQQLVENAKQIDADTKSAALMLDAAKAGDNSWHGNWDSAEGLSRTMLTEAHLALAEEALANAKEKNKEDE